jgi:hypothetical protein
MSFRELATMGGIFHELLPISGWCAMQRGSNSSEAIDLVKAIYLVDLEHVSKYWSSWEDFEEFIIGIPLAGGRKISYINRSRELFESFMAGRDEPAIQFVSFATPSLQLQEIVLAARELAFSRSQNSLPPRSCDFLHCICKQDKDLSQALQESGLELDRLISDIT